ncbi:YndM family protein [Oceanobacillus rekensis]|uniref:YndM family protein n=1 Tax=Oceanobacillus rekensis TaxID=937927 RepID=UPI000B43E913|nr:YndM family protein [Oceanobacillus rekensis]
MKYLGPLIIKFLMTTAVLWIVLGLFFGVTFGDIIMTSIILTVVASLGDLFILPRIGNTAASIADFALAWVVVWLAGINMYGEGIAIGTAAFVSAIAITVGEVFLHRYLKNSVFKDEKYRESKVAYFPNNYQTEFSSDNDDVQPKDEK